MHQKKSETHIGKESSGVSSDFNPSPPLLFFPHHHHLHHHRDSSSPATPYKRPLLTHRLSPPPPRSSFRYLRRFPLFLLFLLPLSYFLLSNPTRSFLVDFLSAFGFSAALLFSLNIALPRLPSIRLFLARSLLSPSRTPLLVFWYIPKSDKRGSSGCWIQVYRNGDVYQGEFRKGKCSGTGVYYYYMSGRYEGDLVDGKYDGFGVETWARGSRYKGMYRQGLRHGCGVYRFYTGDMFSGEWSSGQSHGCGVHTCECVYLAITCLMTSIFNVFFSFFTWFSDAQHKEDVEEEIHDEVADIIKEDLWPNPLTYFNNEADEEDFDGDDDGDEEGKKGDSDDEEDEDGEK